MIGVVTFRSVLQIVVRSVVQEVTSFITKDVCVTTKRKIVQHKKDHRAVKYSSTDRAKVNYIYSTW